MEPMPRSFKLGMHRIAIRRPRRIDIEPSALDVRNRCEIAPPRRRVTIGSYETDLPRSNSTWKGSFHYRDKIVNVISGLDGTVAQEVLAHEIGHAVWDYCGLPDVIPARYEEIVIGAWSQVWLGVMRENQKLARFLLG